MDKCKGLIGFVLGHCFVHVITKSEPSRPINVDGSGSFAVKVIDCYRSQNYEGIYCKRCGKVVNK